MSSLRQQRILKGSLEMYLVAFKAKSPTDGIGALSAHDAFVGDVVDTSNGFVPTNKRI